VTEEALKCKGIGAVVAEMNGVEFLHSRRFQLAVEKSLVTAFIINHKKGEAANNACISRWKITTTNSHIQDGLPGVGNPVWDVQLEKIRNGKAGQWLLQWDGDAIKEIKTKEAIIASTILRKRTG
jgi:protein ImuA